MLNTSNTPIKTWSNKQEAFIASLKLQPLIVVLRPAKEDFLIGGESKPLIKRVEFLYSAGIKHIEIAWTPIGDWSSLVKNLHKLFPEIFFGAASITSQTAFDDFRDSGLSYAMTPIWDQMLQEQALKLGHILIPGVLTPTEIQHAISFGWKIIKVFPASLFGPAYIKQLEGPIQKLPFVIAAGGIYSKNIKDWLDAGYDAIAIGRGNKKNQHSDNHLEAWLKVNKFKI